MKKGRKVMRAVLYQFEKMEPGEVVTKEMAEEGARRLDRVHINPSSFAKGVKFAGIAAGTLSYEASESRNPVPLPQEIVSAGVPVKLTLANYGDIAVYPSAVVVMEVL